MEHEGDNYTNRDWLLLGTITKGLVKGLEDLKDGGRMETIQTTTLLRTGQNREKSPIDLRRVVVTQTPVKNHRLKVMWKILKE